MHWISHEMSFTFRCLSPSYPSLWPQSSQSNPPSRVLFTELQNSTDQQMISMGLLLLLMLLLATASHGWSSLFFLSRHSFTLNHRLSISLFFSTLLPVFINLCSLSDTDAPPMMLHSALITCHPFTRDPSHLFSPRNQDVRHSPPVLEVKRTPLSPSAIFDCVPPSCYCVVPSPLVGSDSVLDVQMWTLFNLHITILVYKKWQELLSAINTSWFCVILYCCKNLMEDVDSLFIPSACMAACRKRCCILAWCCRMFCDFGRTWTQNAFLHCFVTLFSCKHALE